ncbi:hypothetical protein VNI00_003002 [Paramarasmius palmivorus]|uniref:Uncharacterized protein n=1 Tax=Paramarasmius palmivorus TaxID=297713 RepID=A0AAW0DYF3_9AGAR
MSRPYKADEAHHLYLTIDDAKIVSASTTVEKMAEMDSDSKLISVKTAGERVKRASETLACPCHEDIAKALLRAVEDFKERITPIFEKAGAQAEEIAQLREDLRRSNKESAKLKKVAASTEAKDRKIAELRAELEETRKISEKALVHAERASTENQRLQGELNRTNQGREEMTRENTRLKGLLEQHNKQNRAQKSKIKGLQDEVARLKQTGHQEASLSLEGQAVISYEDQLRTPSPSPSSPLNTTLVDSRPYIPHHDKENTHHMPRLDYEGMPTPGFSSDWTMGRDSGPSSRTIKRKLSLPKANSSSTLPIPLDRKGRPTVAVQLGPKRSRRAP